MSMRAANWIWAVGALAVWVAIFLAFFLVAINKA